MPIGILLRINLMGNLLHRIEHNRRLQEEVTAKRRPAEKMIQGLNEAIATVTAELPTIKKARPERKKPTAGPAAARSKRAISIRLDEDVIDQFKRSGNGWQSRINEVLRKSAKLPL